MPRSSFDNERFPWRASRAATFCGRKVQLRAFAAAPVLVGRAALGTPDLFRLGVASGSPAAEGFVPWIRLAPEPQNYDAATPAA